MTHFSSYSIKVTLHKYLYMDFVPRVYIVSNVLYSSLRIRLSIFKANNILKSEVNFTCPATKSDSAFSQLNRIAIKYEIIQ